MQKKILIFLGCILFVIMIGSGNNLAAGNPPSNIILSYDSSSQILSAEITHNVADPNTHYIATIEIQKNSIVIDTPIYSSQPTANTFTYTYTVAAQNDDVLTVTAICSIAGSLSKSLTISSNPQTSQSVLESLFQFPHFIWIGLGLILMLVGIIFIYLHKPHSWFLLHKIFSSIGVFSTILGILLLPQLIFTLPHTYLGLIGAIGMAVCIAFGVYFGLQKKKNRKVRMAHIWQGRMYFILMIIAAFLGMYLFGVFG
jgi:hypothetical protein